MKIIVCMKVIADPEAPEEAFRLDPEKMTLISSPKVLKVPNPFDEQAVEAALRIKDKMETHITILSLGHGLDRVAVKKPIQMGADELVLLEDEAFVSGDSWSTALALSAAIKKIGEYDLILCGRQAADLNAGQVGLGIAEMLGLPGVGVARKIEIIEGTAKVERVITNGYEVIEVALPAVITVSNELGAARYPSIQNIRKSNEIQPRVWNPTALGLEPANVGSLGRKLKLLRLYQPVHEGDCELVKGETLQEAGENLALCLRKERIL
jgi:electron transfer flavoprotein beta subunit